MSISKRKFAANRANAKKSSGPNQLQALPAPRSTELSTACVANSSSWNPRTRKNTTTYSNAS